MGSPVRTVPGGLGRLSEDVIVELSESLGEPAWLRERRLAAGRAYAALPLPRWERGIRGWWTTDLSHLDLDQIAPYRLESRPPAGRSRTQRAERAGLLEQRDSVVVDEQLVEDARAKGVIFGDLSRAAREREDLVRPYLGGLVSPTEDKFVALHSALWSGGAFIYVPARVEVTLPLQSIFRLETPGLGVFIRVLLIAEQGSRVTYLEEYASDEMAGQGLHSGVVEVYARNGADVEFVALHNWGTNVFEFHLKRAVIENNAHLRWVTGFLGSALTKASVETYLRGSGASLDSVGVFFGSGQQHLDLTSRTFHEAPHTSGDVLFKGVVNGAARAALEGVIRVEKQAQQTTSYLSDHTLQLSREAKSEAVPSLEIEANDVRVSHGATVGMIDPEQLYYLETRGLPRAEAERTIVEGFFEPVLQRVPLPGVRRELLQSIRRKMGD